MRFLRVLSLILCLMCLAAGSTAAQSVASRPWEVILANSRDITVANNPTTISGITVQVVTDQGLVEGYPLPAALFEDLPPSAYDLEVSAGHETAALVLYISTAERTVADLMFLNLPTMSCCVNTEIAVNVEGYSLGGFDPTGTRFAVGYAAIPDLATYNIEGGIAVVNTQTGQVTHRLTTADFANAFPQYEYVATLRPDRWTADGIHFTPSCWACEPPPQIEYFVWNPDTNILAQSYSSYFSIFGDTLPLTGEMIYTYENTTLPTSGLPSYFPPANVLEFYSNGIPMPISDRPTQQGAAPVVYFDQRDLNLSHARWVADGSAVYIPGSDMLGIGRVLLRSGQVIETDIPNTMEFLAGTTNGWLMHDTLNDKLIHYALSGSIVTPEPKGSFEAGILRVVGSTPLGALGGLAVFPTLNMPATSQPLPSATPSCPGVITPRLRVNGMARVTPGDPNNLRAQPSTSATRLGTIPGGSIFTVLEGPYCPGDGFVWWRVEFNGQVGWTVEGQNNTYYTEPVN